MTEEKNKDWQKAGLQDFLKLDRQLDQKIPLAYRDGAHIAVFAAIQHFPTVRVDEYIAMGQTNQVHAFRMIKDHGGLPLSTDTILSLYSALQEGKPAAWKQENVYLENEEGFYIPASAEKTPEAMEKLCREYAFLNDPCREQFDEIFKFILNFICIHPFLDGNGRMSALLLQFLLQKAGLKCAVYLPVDPVMNGVYSKRTCLEIRAASGAFYGMKPMQYDHYISYMKEILSKCYEIMMNASIMLEERPLP